MGAPREPAAVTAGTFVHDTLRATWRISLHLTAHQLVTAAGVASLGVLARERDGVVQRGVVVPVGGGPVGLIHLHGQMPPPVRA